MFLLRDNFEEICQILQDGGLIVYPTDTIWGIGCDATNERAIARVSELKKRPPEKGYVLLVDSIEMLKQHAAKIHPRVETLLAHHGRPLTVIYPTVYGLPPSAKAADGSAAIRVTTDRFCKELIRRFGKPILSTSANVSGQPFPAHFGEISSEVLSAVEYVVRFRQDDKTAHEPSVIATFDRHGELEFVRE